MEQVLHASPAYLGYVVSFLTIGGAWLLHSAIGLEVLIIADIIRTIVVDQSVESVVVLGIIVLIRVVLSFSLEVEIDGMWPWNRWRIPLDKSPTDDS